MAEVAIVKELTSFADLAISEKAAGAAIVEGFEDGREDRDSCSTALGF